ncbi:MAG: SDR family oxidoreductase [Leptospiraceae bacterium]|nr:SDR family oxidoreductase [Leptospiraceae bacterium]
MTSIKSLVNMKGRNAIVTGAAGHLGKVISETLAELGANLILIDRENSSLEKLSLDLKNYNVKIHYFQSNLESSSERKELILYLNKFTNINVLVNNAAFVGTAELEGWAVSFLEQTVETWRRAVEVNLTSIFELTQGISTLMQGSQGANIINIASIYGQYAPKWALYEGTNMSNPAAYATSKAGLIQYSRWLATTLAPKVRVNCVSPGGIFRNQPDSFVTKYIENTPLNRMATEKDFKGVIAFLASDLSEYVTGQNISVDGGWGIW